MMDMTRILRRQFFTALLCALCAGSAGAAFAATRSEKLPIAARWGRFEQSFKSSVSYTNAPQQAELTVTFLSPRGRTVERPGFWDGGRTWRVRFKPDEPGRWTFQTHCSDARNKGLHNQSGAFICSTPIGQSRFNQHGPVQVRPGNRHFEHADGTPFFWMADIAWNGAQLSEQRDWEVYAQIRASQKFSAVQWAVIQGQPGRQAPFSGHEQISIQPEVFKRLDAKVTALNRAGLLSVIAPLWDTAARDLPEEQAALLLRYMVARWGAHEVAWLLTTEGGIARCKKIGARVFNGGKHAPVILYPGELNGAFDEFRNEAWVSAFGYGLGQHTDADSLKWLTSGPLSTEWKQQPARPAVHVVPPLENSLPAQSEHRVNADEIRRITWWSLTLAPAAGVSYGAADVANWNTTPAPAGRNRRLPVWHVSLFLPGAKQMTALSEYVRSVDFRRLQPALQTIAFQPGETFPRRFIGAVESGNKNFSLIYVPEDRTVEVLLSALPPSPAIKWFNPRTGETKAAVAVVGSRTAQLPTPDSGDWLLILSSEKPLTDR